MSTVPLPPACMFSLHFSFLWKWITHRCWTQTVISLDSFFFYVWIYQNWGWHYLNCLSHRFPSVHFESAQSAGKTDVKWESWFHWSVMMFWVDEITQQSTRENGNIYKLSKQCSVWLCISSHLPKALILHNSHSVSFSCLQPSACTH